MGEVWTTAAAIALCREIEAVCPDFGAHVALTGGLLYKDGARKDADILFYRIRQKPSINTDGLFDALEDLGCIIGEDFGWCVKANYLGKPIDFFFPEREGDEYPQINAADRIAKEEFL